MKIESTGKPSV